MIQGALVLVAVSLMGAGAARAVEAGHDDEIALALEAAPAGVGAKAGVYVHDQTGYVKARESENGFVCLVDHRIPNAVEPQCMDAEGVKTFLPKYLMVASMRAQGKSQSEIHAAVNKGFSSGKLKAPKRPGVIYMMSSHNVVTIDEDKGIAAPFPPHLMFYAPNMTSADVGSDGTPASPIFVVDEKTPHALMIVPVAVGMAGHAGHAGAEPK